MTVPEEWKETVFLTFYSSDDYHTDAWRPDGSWLTAEGFIGHRFKQVLVDNHVVWSSDVCDPVEKGKSPYYRVKMPVKPGQTFLLTLLVYDAESSTSVLADDFYQSARNKIKREDDPNASNFQTHVYWGDMRMVEGATSPKPGKRASEFRLRAVHNRRWPLPPFGDGWKKKTVLLTLSAPAGLPKRGFPVQCGVPMPAKKLEEVSGVRLLTSGKKGRYTQKNVLGQWPDESLQWVLFDFLAKQGEKAFELGFVADQAKPSSSIKIAEQQSLIKVDAGGLAFNVRTGDPVWDVKLNGTDTIDTISLSIQVEGEEIPGTVDSLALIDAGPFRTTIKLHGHFNALKHSYGSFHLYCSAYAGLPYLKLWFRWFNDTDTPLAVSAQKITFLLPKLPVATQVPDWNLKDGAMLRQITERERFLDATPVNPEAPMFLAWEEGAIAVRNFRELYPKSASQDGKRLVIDLIAAAERPIVFTPGEAKSHEVWLSLGEKDPAQFAATVEHPPMLHNASYFCATGVLGHAAPHGGVPVLHEQMVEAAGMKRWEDLGQRFGVRDFPDSAYAGGLPNWANNYYERMLGLYSEWFMSGDRLWYNRANDVCRHLMDVAVVHSDVPGRDWLGAIHGPGREHVAGPWNPTLRIAGLALYHKLTGDPEAREAILGVADFCMRTQAGIDGKNVRQQAAPFDAICTAYGETANVAYLDAGAAYVDSVLRAMDMRRGVWPDEHGSAVYRGNVPWMAAQMGRPLYLWYHMTGDLHAAQALVGLAESIVCENMDWETPGVVAGYSHNPRYKVTAQYDPLIIPVIFAAYELTEDPFFLEAAKAQWQRWRRAKALDSPMNCHWHTPWLVWYLKHYKIIEALDGSGTKAK